MNLFFVPACGTGVIVVDIAAVGPAVVRVGVETSFPGFDVFFPTVLGVGGDFAQGIA